MGLEDYKTDDSTSPLLRDTRDHHESVTEPGSSQGTDEVFVHKRVLSISHVVALTFFNVSGGPFGTEGVIKAAGPLVGLLGFLLLPWVWSLPMALVTAELSTAFPTDGGYTVWAGSVFGNFWGFQMGWWQWLSGVVDNSLYPVMICAYLLEMFGVDALGDLSSFELWLLKAAFTLLLTAVNLRGLDIVGNMSVAVNIAVIVPFIIMCFWGIKDVDPNVWVAKPPPNISWTNTVNLILWNLNSFDSVSTIAGEVKNPGKTYPKAMTLALFLIIATYFFPLLIGSGVDHDLDKWKDGYFTKVSENICGRWMGYVMLLAACLSCTSLFTAELATDSYQLCGMSEQGLVPKLFARRLPNWDTPFIAVAASTVCILFLITFPFDIIMQIENVVYSFAMVLECAAMIALRIKRPDIERPYRVPMGVVSLFFFLFPVVALCVVVLVVADPISLLVSGIAIAFGVVMSVFLQHAKSKQWLSFVHSREE